MTAILSLFEKNSWIVLIISILFSAQALAQTPSPTPALSKKTKRTEPLLPKFSLDAVRFGFDLTNFGNGVFSKNIVSYYTNIRKYGVTADVAMFDNRFFVLGEVGYSDVRRNLISVFSISPNRGGFSYDNVGWYWRVGFDYNVMWKNFRKDAILVGLRYGGSTFSDKLVYNQTVPVWGFLVNQSAGIFNRYEGEIINNNNPSAYWFEIVTGLRVTVWRNIQLGYTMRYKFLISNQLGSDQLVSNEIPGYGTTEQRQKPAFSYHVYYHLPLKKKKSSPK